ncbi:MAG: DUF6259 domain-containing protein [Eubacteriales bacterium]|nr:DUF6259 domain-containing protein [Eubacteriales bacterium]
MYQSRLHATNGVISLAVDSLSGELLEFVRESTADNLLKNHVRRAWSLLDGLLVTDQGDLRFHPPRYADIKRDPSLTPEISVQQEERQATLHWFFPALIADEARLELNARITVRLLPEDCRAYWTLTLDNRTGFELDDIAFPVVDGAWLGESWQDDVLVYPHFAGCRIDNPTEQLASEPQLIHWKWQEYIYEYNIGQETGARDDRGAYVHRLNYSGQASMVWMDLYNPTEKTGVYITCRNSSLTMKALRMESFGKTDPGVGMAILHRPGQKNGVWSSEECILAFHEGDWHWAADDYRAWFATLPRRNPPYHRPEWFEKSPGLMAHYDFQYQGGGIVHTFRDIPDLLREAQKLGFNHLLLSGWNEDGFDFGFPHYTPNHRLGTEQELKDALAQCKQLGGHVCFYINSRLCNIGFADQQDRIQKSAIMNRDGSLFIEKYGADDLAFASLCINDTAWRRALAETVRYLTQDLGADGMYLDQLAMATSCKCYHPGHKEHAHNPTAWNQGYEKLLAEMQRDYAPEGMALIYEGCNDAFGPYASGQLVSELHCPFRGRMPEVYKYTFPDQILVDMMNPRRNSAMRPEHIARHSTELLYNAFTMGAYFWCYDLEWDNTWRRDPEQYERLKRLTALRVSWLKHFGHGRFTDTVGVGRAPKGQQIRRYLLQNGALLACAAEKGLAGAISLAWDSDKPPVCQIMTLRCPEPTVSPCKMDKTQAGSEVVVALPEDEAAVIVLLRG